MPSTPTARNRFELQETGEGLNVWGAKLNQTAISLIDEAISGVEAITVTGDLTLTSLNYASDQHRNAVLLLTGSPTGPFTVTVPSVEKRWDVVNNTGQSATFKTAAGSGAVIPGGDRGPVYCDGTNCGLAGLTEGRVNAIVAAAGLSGSLPPVAGNAGEFLRTDGAAIYWDAVPTPDVGGGGDAVITASTTLPASAAVVQPVNMASASQSVTLPAATGLSKGGRKYVIANKGSRTFGVRDNAGALLAAVAAGGVAELHLDDNSTAAGSWTVTGRGLEPALVAVDATLPSTYTTAVEVACRLTDTLSVHFAQNASGHLFAVAADSAGGTVGTPVAVDVAGTTTVAHCFRVSDTQAIVFWVQGSNHKAAVLTVDPVTKAVGAGTPASTTTAFLSNASFTGRPAIAQITSTLYVALYGSGGNAIAISVTGSAASIGTGVASGAVTARQALALYRVSDATALALYIDDSGTAGSPYSIRGVVLSVSGTTITVGASAGVNDVVSSAVPLPSCQMSSTKFVVGWNGASSVQAVAFTVSGTTVSVGSPATVQVASLDTGYNYSTFNANRFQPNLFAIDASRALFTFGSVTVGSSHVVLTESSGTLMAGAILFSLWAAENGGNFPQTPQGFLAFAADQANARQSIFGVTVNGTALDISGTLARGGMAFEATSTLRFGLSGGVCGIYQTPGYAASSQLARRGELHLARFRANAAPLYLGSFTVNNYNVPNTQMTPVEVASNKVAITGPSLAQSGSATTPAVRLVILEFAA